MGGKSRLRAVGFVSLAVLAGAGLRAQADYYVGGLITNNQTWTAATSPYHVTNTITVLNSATLTIKSGVEVRFTNGTALQVADPISDASDYDRGAIKILGIDSSSVVFTSESGQGGGWQGVVFGPRSDDGVTSTVRYLKVNYAGQINALGVTAGLTLYRSGSGMVLDHLVSLSGTGEGVYALSSSLTMHGGMCLGNAGNGIHAGASTVAFSGVSVRGNSGMGVLAESCSGTMTGCVVASNARYGLALVGSSLTVAENSFATNGDYAMWYNVAACNPSIYGNELSANQSPGIQISGGAVCGNHTLYKQVGEPIFTVTDDTLQVIGARTLTVSHGVTVRFSYGLGLVIASPSSHYESDGRYRGSLDAQGTESEPVVFTSVSGAAQGWQGITFGPDSDSYCASALRHVVVEKAGQTGVLGYDANLVLNQTGVGGAVLLDHVTCRDSGSLGLAAVSACVNVTDSQVSGNGSHGLCLYGSSLGATNVNLSGNGGFGAYLESTVGRCTGGGIVSNQSSGVYCTGGSSVTFDGVTNAGNAAYGFYWADFTSAGAIMNCVIDGNVSCPARVSALTDVRSNTFARTAVPGIELIGGTIMASDAVWHHPGSGDLQPYIHFNVTHVMRGRKLTVDPGVIVRYRSGSGLEIGHPDTHYDSDARYQGRLEVLGTADEPVTFTSDSGASGGWKGVLFGPDSDFGCASTLRHLTVEKAGQANSIGFSADVCLYLTGSGWPALDHVTARDSGGAGFWVNGSRLVLSNGMAQGNSTYGVYADSSSLTMAGGVVAGNATGIRYATASAGSVSGVDFDQARDNGTDLHLDDSTGVGIGANNHFAGDTCFIYNNCPRDYDLSANGTTFDVATDVAVERKVYHRVDKPTLGLIDWGADCLVGSRDGTVLRIE